MPSTQNPLSKISMKRQTRLLMHCFLVREEQSVVGLGVGEAVLGMRSIFREGAQEGSSVGVSAQQGKKNRDGIVSQEAGISCVV